MAEHSAEQMADFVAFPDEDARRYRAAGYWTDETFGSVVAQLRTFGSRTAVIGRDAHGREVTVDYTDLADRVAALAGGLARIGFGRGDRVVVQLPNVIEFVETILALFRLGAVPVFALAAHRRREIAHFVASAEARGYITSAAALPGAFDYREIARALVADHDTLLVVVAGHSAEFTNMADLRAAVPTERDRTGRPEDLALLQLSGGTTGLPKLIPRTHADYLYSIRASNEICHVGPDTVMLIVLPAAHNFPASSPGWLGALYAGATVVLAADPSPSTCFSLIERHAVTMTALVPPLARLWAMTAGDGRVPARSLSVVQVGGAQLEPVAARDIARALGTRLQQVFGMAEGLVNYTRLDDPDDVVFESQGRPISPMDEVRVTDDEGRPVAPGAVGHLETRGPYTIHSYYRASAGAAEAFAPDGFYRTGDLVRMRPDGNIVVCGRAKDQINRGGEKFGPGEIEDILRTHPGIADAAVVAIPDAFVGEKSCAFVVVDPRAQRAPTVGETRDFVADAGVAPFKLPDRIEFVGVLPTTAVGKVDKRRLASMV